MINDECLTFQKSIATVSKFLNQHKHSHITREVTLGYAHLEWFIHSLDLENTRCIFKQISRMNGNSIRYNSLQDVNKISKVLLVRLAVTTYRSKSYSIRIYHHFTINID